ncbi:hypothetical protein ABE488_00820 [Luteimonas sp. TWI662]|uniref:hypothetical protein n=1 Tax=Luteimonas sp. TWI662 TaxID=3136789 RepID=UPI003208E4E7
MSSFAKLDGGIVDSTLWMQPHDVLRVWIALMAKADASGYVRASVPSLAHLCMVPIERLEQILAILTSPDPYSRTPTDEGRRLRAVEGGWELVNYIPYRNSRDEDADRARKREWDRKNRPSGHARKRGGEGNGSEDAEGAEGSSDDGPTESDDSPTVRQQSDEVRQSPTQAEAEAEADKAPSLRSGGGARKRAPAPKAITSIKGVAVPARPDGVEPQTWADWLGLRKAKSAPVTQTVVCSAEAEAAKAGMTLERFLRIWCARGSQGLQADWLKPNERAGPGVAAAAAPSKTRTAIETLQGMKNANRHGLDPRRNSGRPEQAALPEPGPHAGHGHDPGDGYGVA